MPVALTIAGSDSGGGAGIQADLKTFSALGVYGASAITALTAQNTAGVRAIHDVPPAFVAEQLLAVLEDIEVDAIKIGMLSTAGIIEAVADVLEGYPSIPVVLDPVMVATSGDALLRDGARATLVARLLPLAALVTPNAPEAALLSGRALARDEAELGAQARRLGARATLVKGGHLDGALSVDLLLAGGTVTRFAKPRVPTANTHGTGCTLSAAIAAGLACGLALADAVAAAERYVHAAILAADSLGVGRGRGPVHHFHAHWT